MITIMTYDYIKFLNRNEGRIYLIVFYLIVCSVIKACSL